MEITSKVESAITNQARRRLIRSFVLRGGRLTEGQKRALTDLWPLYGIELGPDMLNFPSLFENSNPVILDIGFGNGESTWQRAAAEPETNFVGVEVHRPGVGHLLLKIDEKQLDNVRIVCADAVDFLENHVADESLKGVCLYFPDPWPKKRHHKRRIVNPGFVALLEAKIQSGGFLHMASDWKPYAEYMLELLTASVRFENADTDGAFSPRPSWRPLTKYETRGQRLGHEVHDLIFRKKS